MPIVAGDIKVYLSGGAGNSDPNAALGGVISATQVTTATLHNLFDKVTGVEAAAGDTEYRCVYVKNTHATLTLDAAAIWISSNSSSPDSTLDIALGGEGAGGTAETVANESTAPIGETFTSPSTYATGLSLGNLAAGVHYPVWIRRTVTAAAAADDLDTATLSVQGDTAE